MRVQRRGTVVRTTAADEIEMIEYPRFTREYDLDEVR
jgi:hypothetical protein